MDFFLFSHKISKIGMPDNTRDGELDKWGKCEV